MDAENGEMFFQDREEEIMAGETWSLDAPFSCSDVIFTASEKILEEWKIDPQCGLKDSESEDVLHAINPNDVFPSGSPDESLSESDSSQSEDPCTETTVSVATAEPAHSPTTIYQVVYDISTLGNIKEEPQQHSVDVISIELDEWSSQILMSDSCIVNELPSVSAIRLNYDHVSSLTSSACNTAPSSPDSSLLYPDLQLTEEEQKLLNQEGISLPNNLPLTKAEERVLKKVRRKIRNKQSAQDSRRRKKEYVDGLEGRAAACSSQNKELQRTVEQLEKHNMSLLAQLRRLQSLIKQTATKAAQTSTCIMIILFSLGLILFPSYSPFRWNSVLEDDYAPTGVISRNILTDLDSSLQIADDVDNPTIQPNSLPVPSDIGKSNSQDIASVLKPPIESPEITDSEGMALEESQPGNGSVLVDRRTETLPLGLMSTSGKGGTNLDPTKPAHADEM
ncbi:cyclic AMP-responsive element-binding protein 3-like protein 4 [Hypomesus transpacificus]|uniref:cyclic AMP-responsive element-binding protein 3-like protein 4 n=1 Tax=Hypomesus transpacificus TaxID=137520 RepID=UPI001F077D96|nr:cyclic AMP-responsive element-binding protein 3-like protein 4 [Hypomesus transpacificus]